MPCWPLEQDDPLPQQLRLLLYEQGRFPTRRTWERRLTALPQTLPGLIGCVGRHLVEVLHPWASHGRAVAVDSTALENERGCLAQEAHKETGEIPHTSIDTEAGWSKSGWHGWWYGWKLHLAVSVGSVWLPLAAELTAANTADNTVAPQLLAPLPAEVRYILGDTHYNDPEVRTLCEQSNRALVAEPGVGPTRTTMMAWKCGVSSISSVPRPLNHSMVYLKTCLSGAPRCL